MTKFGKTIGPMLATCFVAGLVLSILAPYDTAAYPPLGRLFYWIGLCIAGGFGASLTDFIARVAKWELSPWQAAFGHSITSTLVVGALVTIIHAKTGNAFARNDIAIILFYVWVIAITLSGIGALLSRSSGKDGASSTSVSRPALFERLAPKLRSAGIYALCAEDHYVRVITSKGEELVLMRLSDAVKETTPLKGLTPHRSWWVAEAGVDTVKKAGLVLHSGQSVPISRTGMKHVRAAGWV